MRKELIFGAVAPKLSEQIKGLDKIFDRDAAEISRLYVRGLLTDGESLKARKRLCAKISTWAENRKQKRAK